MHRPLLALSLVAVACSAWSNQEQPAPELPMLPLPWLDAPADASIVGRVRRDDDSAAPGARVCAWHPAPQQLRPGDRLPRCADAGPDGRYTIAGLVPATYIVQASAAGLRPAAAPQPVSVRAGQRSDDTIVTLAPGGVELRGEVVDLRGAPVARAWVSNQSLFEEFAERGAGVGALTDEQGRFSVWLEPGAQRLIVHAAGFAPTITRADAALAPPRLVLGPAAEISGTVIDAVSRAPIAGARVRARPSELDVLGDDYVDYTDAAGAFTLSRLPPGRYTLIGETGNRRGEADRLVTVGLGEAASVPPMALVSRPSVRGVVAGCAGGRLVPAGVYDEGEPIGVDGEVFLPALAPGRYEPAILCQGRQPSDVPPTFTLTDAPLTAERWSTGRPHPRPFPDDLTDPRGEIHGLVVDAAGAPVPGARVRVADNWLQSDDLPTDALGRFVIHAAPPGDQRVVANPPSSLRAEPEYAAQQINVVAGRVHELRLALPGAADPIRGRVVRDGAPVPNAAVVLVLDHSDEPRERLRPPPRHHWHYHDDLALTDESGRFSFPRTYAGGRYYLWAYPLGGGDVMALDVLTGSDVTLDVPPRAAVAGTLPGRPPQRFVVGVSDGAGGLRERRLFEHTDGRWGFDDLPPGAHDLLFVAPGMCATASVTLVGGERLGDVQPTAGELGGVRGRVIDGAINLAEPRVDIVVRAADPRLAALEDELGGHTTLTDADGEFELLGLCPGAIDVTATTPLRAAKTRAEISPRSIVHLSLALHPTSDSD